MHLSQIVNYDVYRSLFHTFVENLCRALSRNPYSHKVMFLLELIFAERLWESPRFCMFRPGSAALLCVTRGFYLLMGISVLTSFIFESLSAISVSSSEPLSVLREVMFVR